MFLNKNHKTHTSAFTLIELMVSIALFAIVVTIALGSIITIADSNKKARSLMSVMNNLNFAVDSMTRSFKSGDIENVSPVITPGSSCFTTEEINYSNASNPFDRRLVQYCVEDGRLTKKIDSARPVPLTSDDVDIKFAEFKLYGGPDEQPLLSIILEGEVKISEKVSSEFTIHTSVNQRKLNLSREEIKFESF